MAPSLKFTIIAWAAIIGWGSPSLVLKDKERAAPLHTNFNVHAGTPRVKAESAVARMKKSPQLWHSWSFTKPLISRAGIICGQGGVTTGL